MKHLNCLYEVIKNCCALRDLYSIKFYCLQVSTQLTTLRLFRMLIDKEPLSRHVRVPNSPCIA